ncbi:MAG: hypothetical protein AAF441_17960, partial [Pseudomonadota bacterium]
SHHSFKFSKQYSGVFQQQGRMFLDADWNELIEILVRGYTEVSELALGTGTPKHDGLVSIAPDGEALIRHDGGTSVAGGVIGNHHRRPHVPSDDDPADVDPAKFPYYIAQDSLPVRVPSPDGDDARFLITRPVEDGVFYVDIWERVVTALETQDLLDAALHGADTCFRKQRMAQIKLANVADLQEDIDPCNPGFVESRIPRTGTALFDAIPAEDIEESSDCDPCAELVSLDATAGNYLFRLELHDVRYDPESRAAVQLVLKWSNDNGAREFRHDDGALMDPARKSYEYFSDATEKLLGMPSDDWPEDGDWRGKLDPADPTALDETLPRIREWDGHCTLIREAADRPWKMLQGRYNGNALASTNDKPAKAGQILVANGAVVVRLDDKTVTLELDGAALLAGDFWLALSRNRAPADERLRVLSAKPIGVRHHYCILGKATGPGKYVKLDLAGPNDERRLSFPALSCLTASDVTYDPSNCAYARREGVEDVQQTLDAFCKRLQHPYLVLRMSQGTGQEAAPGEFLPCPVSVHVENEHGHPVPDIEVRFTVAHTAEDQVFANIADLDPTKLQQDVGITTNEQGAAFAHWFVNGDEGCHGLRAELEKVPQDKVSPVWFSSLVRVLRAEDVAYEPGCEFLKEKGASNVEQALNHLCAGLGQAGDPDLPKVSETSWTNDQALTVGTLFSEGITVSFTEKMHPICATSDNFIVELEVPETTITTASKILAGTITGHEDQTKWTFKLSNQDTFAGLAKDWFERIKDMGLDHPGLRCRVTLKAESIFAGDAGDLKTPRYLDGNSFKSINLDRPRRIFLDLRGLPEGDGIPGGDFESWFYLIQNQSSPQPQLDNPLRLRAILGRTLAQMFDPRLANFASTRRDIVNVFSNVISNPTIRTLLGENAGTVTLTTNRRATPDTARRAHERLGRNANFTLLTTSELAPVATEIISKVQELSAARGVAGFSIALTAEADAIKFRQSLNTISRSLVLIDDRTAEKFALDQADASLEDLVVF